MAAEYPLDRPPIPAFDQTTPVANVFSLATIGGVEHRIDAAEREFLWIAPDVSYPRGVQGGAPLAEIVLEPAGDDPNVFRLPDDYISLQHVLNEAVGARGSGDRSAPEEAGPQAIRQALGRVGEAIGDLALKGGLLPASLDYTRIILERDHRLKTRLIPPAEFVPVRTSPPSIAFARLQRSLGASMYEGATSTDQRDLVGVGLQAFREGVVKAYRGVR